MQSRFQRTASAKVPIAPDGAMWITSSPSTGLRSWGRILRIAPAAMRSTRDGIAGRALMAIARVAPISRAAHNGRTFIRPPSMYLFPPIRCAGNITGMEQEAARWRQVIWSVWIKRDRKPAASTTTTPTGMFGGYRENSSCTLASKPGARNRSQLAVSGSVQTDSRSVVTMRNANHHVRAECAGNSFPDARLIRGEHATRRKH